MAQTQFHSLRIMVTEYKKKEEKKRMGGSMALYAKRGIIWLRKRREGGREGGREGEMGS